MDAIPGGASQDPAFDWLVQLDREIRSPMELLEVSAWEPGRLTGQFLEK